MAIRTRVDFKRAIGQHLIDLDEIITDCEFFQKVEEDALHAIDKLRMYLYKMAQENFRE